MAEILGSVQSEIYIRQVENHLSKISLACSAVRTI